MNYPSTSLKTEKLTAYLFHRWTDGPKWVLDTMNVFPLDKADTNVNFIRLLPDELDYFLVNYPYKSVTFFVIAQQEQVQRLVNTFPDFDIIRLTI